MSATENPISDLERAAAAADHPLHTEYLRSMIGRGDKARQELRLIDGLVPMLPTTAFAQIEPGPHTVEIIDPNHFLRTLQFVHDNGLRNEFWTPFHHLMNLLAQTGGKLWPDGQDVPSFTWQGCGMFGGFIFHRHSRDWSIHT
jgi:hypothetical protein